MDFPENDGDEGATLVAPRPTQFRLSTDEWFEISQALESHHALFYQVWQMGRPCFTEDIPTAAVQFDETGDFIWFYFNPHMWKRMDMYNRLFVICHEALHVALNHGIRTRDAMKANRGATNAALDVVVNHMLTRSFGFERKKLSDGEDYCWVDTVFPKGQKTDSAKLGDELSKLTGKKVTVKSNPNRHKDIPEDETFEFYYNLFDSVHGMGGGDMGFETVDDHSGLSSGNWDKVIDKLNESLTPEEKASLKENVEKHFQNKDNQSESLNAPAGSGTGSWVFVNPRKVKKKKKWETVIKKWSSNYLRSKEKDVEQWARLNRRLTMLPKDMFLPSDMEVYDEDFEQKRIPVYFFLDTSGSCWGLKDRFFEAAMSLPEERFDIRLFCFDTAVQETTLESKKVYGGGGTSFKIMEDYIQKEISSKKLPYPEAVFVITDGYGDKIKPQHPRKWYWFLTPGGSKSCIDPECNFFKLEDYE